MTQDELDQIVEAHELWICGRGGAQADLSGKDISNLNLEDAELTAAKMIRTNMSGCNMRGCVLEEAVCSGANMSGVDATGAHMSNSYMEGTNLTGACLNEADLVGAYLNEANLAGARMIQVNLVGACLEGAKLTGADVRWASIFNTCLTAVTWPDGRPTATDEQSEELARAIARIVLNDPNSLDMRAWHCETAHCLAGWAETIVDKKIDGGDTAEIRGHQLLPTLSHLFHSDHDEVLEVLRYLVKE